MVGGLRTQLAISGLSTCSAMLLVLSFLLMVSLAANGFAFNRAVRCVLLHLLLFFMIRNPLYISIAMASSGLELVAGQHDTWHSPCAYTQLLTRLYFYNVLCCDERRRLTSIIEQRKEMNERCRPHSVEGVCKILDSFKRTSCACLWFLMCVSP